MTPDEKKAKLLGKLNEEPKPIFTQVVRVEEKPAKNKKKVAIEPTEHFNVYLPVSLASDLRMHKARTRISIQDAVSEAVRDYLAKHHALTVK